MFRPRSMYASEQIHDLFLKYLTERLTKANNKEVILLVDFSIYLEVNV